MTIDEKALFIVQGDASPQMKFAVRGIIEAYESAKAPATDQPDENTLIGLMLKPLLDAFYQNINWDVAFEDNDFWKPEVDRVRAAIPVALQRIRPFLRQPEREAVKLDYEEHEQLVDAIDQAMEQVEWPNKGEAALTALLERFELRRRG